MYLCPPNAIIKRCDSARFRLAAAAAIIHGVAERVNWPQRLFNATISSALLLVTPSNVIGSHSSFVRHLGGKFVVNSR